MALTKIDRINHLQCHGSDLSKHGIQVRVDENTKTSVDSLFSSLGLDISTAIAKNMTLLTADPNIHMYAVDWTW